MEQRPLERGTKKISPRQKFTLLEKTSNTAAICISTIKNVVGSVLALLLVEYGNGGLIITGEVEGGLPPVQLPWMFYTSPASNFSTSSASNISIASGTCIVPNHSLQFLSHNQGTLLSFLCSLEQI